MKLASALRWPGRSRLGADADRRGVERGLIGLVGAIVVVSAAMVGLTLNYLHGQAIESGERLNLSFARVVEEQTTRTLQTVDEQLQLASSRLAQLQATGDLSEGVVHDLLREQIRELPFVRAMWVLDAQGRLLYDSDTGNIGLDLSHREYFEIYRTQPQTQLHLGLPVRSGRGVWVMSVTRPLHTVGGAFTGIVVAALDPAYFDRLWGIASLGEGGTVSLLRSDGTLMMHSPFDDARLGQVVHDLALTPALVASQPNGVFRKASVFDGQVRHFVYRRLSAQPDLSGVVPQCIRI